jgi:hypothetical protein
MWRGAVPILVMCTAALVSCERSAVEGTVVDAKGQALPGVAVTSARTAHQALTDAVGRYRLECRPGVVVLDFFKTGYAPGALELAVRDDGRVVAPAVTLRRLPPGAGVYLLEGHRYQALAAVLPERFMTGDGQAVYGTASWAEVSTADREPLIVCHKMPVDSVRLARLEIIEAAAPDSRMASGAQEAWVSVESIPVTAPPIDEPEGLLHQLKPSGPLEPGSYAVHWGALEGDTTLESRIYPFSIGEAVVTPHEPSTNVARDDKPRPSNARLEVERAQIEGEAAGLEGLD